MAQPMTAITRTRSTAERLVRLIEQDKVCNQASAARVLGVSRERVRQILNRQGISFHKHQKNTLISWLCAGCGQKVEMWTVFRNNPRTGLCNRCANAARRKRVTIQCADCGERREVRPCEASAVRCRACFETQAIVRCPDCGKERSMAPSHIKRLVAGRCKPCNNRFMSDHPIRTRNR